MSYTLVRSKCCFGIHVLLSRCLKEQTKNFFFHFLQGYVGIVVTATIAFAGFFLLYSYRKLSLNAIKLKMIKNDSCIDNLDHVDEDIVFFSIILLFFFEPSWLAIRSLFMWLLTKFRNCCGILSISMTSIKDSW